MASLNLNPAQLEQAGIALAGRVHLLEQLIALRVQQAARANTAAETAKLEHERDSYIDARQAAHSAHYAITRARQNG